VGRFASSESALNRLLEKANNLMFGDWGRSPMAGRTSYLYPGSPPEARDMAFKLLLRYRGEHDASQYLSPMHAL
jgi:hypothetical protein